MEKVSSNDFAVDKRFGKDSSPQTFRLADRWQALNAGLWSAVEVGTRAARLVARTAQQTHISGFLHGLQVVVFDGVELGVIPGVFEDSGVGFDFDGFDGVELAHNILLCSSAAFPSLSYCASQ